MSSPISSRWALRSWSRSAVAPGGGGASLRATPAGESFAGSASTVLSVHNPGYQGHFPPETIPDVGLPWAIYNWLQLEWYGKMNFLKGGLAFTDFVTTVSPTQARELRTPGGGFGLHGVV